MMNRNWSDRETQTGVWKGEHYLRENLYAGENRREITGGRIREV